MKVTIIIPVYNLENYIKNTLNSVLNQQFDNELEVIVVDDGSTDNSFSVIRTIADQDQRVIVISQENAGVSAARNIGIERATGDYIMFVDGDDILRSDAVHILFECMQSDEKSILASARQVRIKSQFQDITVNNGKMNINSSDAIIKDILKGQFDVSACAKLFARELIG
ncbi:MAG: glycosyltransferase [Clostridia bacterium]|nr:glycosyltransferase [Clostridia bacterium]